MTDESKSDVKPEPVEVWCIIENGQIYRTMLTEPRHHVGANRTFIKYVPASALESANARIAELRLELTGGYLDGSQEWRKQRARIAELEHNLEECRGSLLAARAVGEDWRAAARLPNLAHLEEAAELLRLPSVKSDGDDSQRLRVWLRADQALRSAPSPLSPDAEGVVERAERCEARSEGGWHCELFAGHAGTHRAGESAEGYDKAPAPLTMPASVEQQVAEFEELAKTTGSASPSKHQGGQGAVEALRGHAVLALREAYAQNKGLWFVADELERLGRDG